MPKISDLINNKKAGKKKFTKKDYRPWSLGETLLPDKNNGPAKEETKKKAEEEVLRQLSGRQKELLILIVKDLVRNKSQVTSPMHAKDLLLQIPTSRGTIKNAARRLEEKGLIKSISKRGRGGFFRFVVDEEILNVVEREFF